jgi:hypothetical protein
MKISVENRLFWYFKDGTELDLDNLSHVDMYVQQVLTHGRTDDIKELVKILSPEVLKESFNRIMRFLPKEVRLFWEAGFGDIGEHSKRNSK